MGCLPVPQSRRTYAADSYLGPFVALAVPRPYILYGLGKCNKQTPLQIWSGVVLAALCEHAIAPQFAGHSCCASRRRTLVGIPAARPHLGAGMKRAAVAIHNSEHKRSSLVTWPRYGEPGRAHGCPRLFSGDKMTR